MHGIAVNSCVKNLIGRKGCSAAVILFSRSDKMIIQQRQRFSGCLPFVAQHDRQFISSVHAPIHKSWLKDGILPTRLYYEPQNHHVHSFQRRPLNRANLAKVPTFTAVTISLSIAGAKQPDVKRFACFFGAKFGTFSPDFLLSRSITLCASGVTQPKQQIQQFVLHPAARRSVIELFPRAGPFFHFRSLISTFNRSGMMVWVSDYDFDPKVSGARRCLCEESSWRAFRVHDVQLRVLTPIIYQLAML